MIVLEALTLSRGVKRLLENARLVINRGEKAALTGMNGTGKTSLMMALAGEIFPESGTLSMPAGRTVAFTGQMLTNPEQTPLQYAAEGHAEIKALNERLADLIASGEEKNALEIADVHERLALAGAHALEANTARILDGLGFSDRQIGTPLGELSGGFQMRARLARTLVSDADVLLLDEPTNHLDINAIVWLENFIRTRRGTVVVISHDREFLDNATNVTIHIEGGKLLRYGGNYSQFELQHARQAAYTQSAIEKQKKRAEHLQSFITRFRSKASKARQAQSRIKALEKMQAITPVDRERAPDFSFETPPVCPEHLVTMENVSCGYATDEGNTVILEKVGFKLRSGSRIGILGANGAGKTTFIRTLAGTLAPLSGELTRSKAVSFGYFAQHEIEKLDGADTPLSFMRRQDKTAKEGELRSYLARFNFTGDSVNEPIAPLSGGERSRLALARIIREKPNVVLLDEPTNHLDLNAREALTEALASFEGAVVVISHDRHLLKATCETIYLAENGTLTEYTGDLDDYRNRVLESKTDKAADKEKPVLNRRDERREQARLRQQLSDIRKPIEKEIRQIEAKMAPVAEKLKTLETLLSQTGIYDASRKDELKQALSEKAALDKENAALEEKWLELNETLETKTAEFEAAVHNG